MGTVSESSKEIKLHFNGLSKQDAEKMAHEAKLARYIKNEILIAEGQHIKGLYQVAIGTVRIEKGGKCIATMSRGQIFGEVAFLHNGSASASVITGKQIFIKFFFLFLILLFKRF